MMLGLIRKVSSEHKRKNHPLNKPLPNIGNKSNKIHRLDNECHSKAFLKITKDFTWILWYKKLSCDFYPFNQLTSFTLFCWGLIFFLVNLVMDTVY